MQSRPRLGSHLICGSVMNLEEEERGEDTIERRKKEEMIRSGHTRWRMIDILYDTKRVPKFPDCMTTLCINI